MEVKDDVFVVFQFTPETVEELRAAFKAGGEVKVREVLTRVRPGMTEEEIVAVVRGLEEEANAAQAAAAPAPATEESAAVGPLQFDPFFGGPDPFRITQEMAPVREPEPAPKPTTEPTTEPKPTTPADDEEEPEDIPPEDVRVEPDPPPHPEEGRGKKVLPLVLIVLLALAIVIVLAVRFCGGQEEPAATAPEEPTPTETVLVIDQEQAIAACEARFQGYLTHDECVKAVQR
ncbi:MAG TPA: hypothetical protein PKY08_00945 [Candidatus Magasanikbacteria bacterium]|nr:hypothetical protein [Candidatus Magasanikbacteria bacterium]